MAIVTQVLKNATCPPKNMENMSKGSNRSIPKMVSTLNSYMKNNTPMMGSSKAQSTSVQFNKILGNLYFFLSEYLIVIHKVEKINTLNIEKKM